MNFAKLLIISLKKCILTVYYIHFYACLKLAKIYNQTFFFYKKLLNYIFYFNLPTVNYCLSPSSCVIFGDLT